MTDPAGQSPSDSQGTRLPEDCVEYMLFLVDDHNTDRRTLLSKLEALKRSALSYVKDVASDYIWQRDEFQLDVKNDQGKLELVIPANLHQED